MCKRFVLFALLLGLTTMQVGCDETLSADEQAQGTEETENSDSRRPLPPKPPLGFAELPTTDPLVANAILARDQIIALEVELLAQLDQLRTVLSEARYDPNRVQQSVVQFLALTKEMQSTTTRAKESLLTIDEKTAELIRASRHLATSYRALAGLYRQKALDYS